MPNKLVISETIENLSMSLIKGAEFTIEVPAVDAKEIRKILESTGKEIKKLGGDDIKITSSIDGLTEKGYTVTFKIETVAGDISTLKKDIWMLLGEKVRGDLV